MTGGLQLGSETLTEGPETGADGWSVSVTHPIEEKINLGICGKSFFFFNPPNIIFVQRLNKRINLSMYCVCIMWQNNIQFN